MKKLVMAVLLGLGASALAACGDDDAEDVAEEVGDEVEDTADNAEDSVD